MLRVLKGNLFNSDRQTLVNTVNCNGVMGAGIALEFRLRHPDMFRQYVDHCASGELKVGKLWLYRPTNGKERRWVLNFPTKKDWKHPSKEEYLHQGLERFVDTYQRCRIVSIAFPVLGALNGKIPEERAIGIMAQHLYACDDIDIDIYRYDPAAEDDLYAECKQRLDTTSDEMISMATGLRLDRVAAIREAMDREEVRSIAQLGAQKGVGVRTLESVFRYITADATKDATAVQKKLEF
ncbi:MAG: macro domain-containing protein [Gammaproteobacteria bacterium]|nr:macro domain-containing protein [Gammaproteobacteria bacterium]MDE0453374.1 macro domain-containing protein [Gammaproteobacteria bacterium]